jgi:hypothetical protein
MEGWRSKAPFIAVMVMAETRLNACRPDLRRADPAPADVEIVCADSSFGTGLS